MSAEVPSQKLSEAPPSSGSALSHAESQMPEQAQQQQHYPPPPPPPTSLTPAPLPTLPQQLSTTTNPSQGRSTPPALHPSLPADATVPPPPPPPTSGPPPAATTANVHHSPTPGQQNFPVYQPQPHQAPPYSPSATYPRRSASPAVEAHDEASSSGPPKKRRRPALSCEPCRRRKVKCDRLQPCSPCVRMGHASACEYDNRFPRSGMAGNTEFSPAVQTHSARPGVASRTQQTPSSGAGARSFPDFEVDVRNHAYATPVHYQGQPSNGSIYANAPPANASDSTPNLLYAVRELQDRMVRMESTNKEAVTKAQPKTDVTLQRSIDTLSTRVQELERALTNSNQPASTLAQNTGLSVPVAAPRTRVDQHAVKFYGPTHYLHLFNTKSDFFGQAMSDQSKAKFNIPQNHHTSPALSLFSQTKALRNTIKERRQQQMLQPETLTQVMRTLPTWEVRDQLVAHYLRTFELIYRIFHIQSLRELYNTHFRELEAAPVVVQAQLLLIFCIGAVFVDETHRVDLLQLVPHWLYAVEAYLSSALERSLGCEDWIRVYCLLILARQSNSVGTKQQTYAIAGTMVRTAFTLGLHRDPKHLLNISPFHAEMRRRLWATILEITTTASSDAAMPPLIADRDYDCEVPLNIDDEYLAESMSALPMASSIDVYTSVSIQILLLQSLSTRLEIYRILNDFKSDLFYDKALELSDALQQACKTAIAFFNKHVNRFSDWSRPKDLHKHIVETLLWNAQLCLHRAFYGAAKKDQRFHYSRHMCLEASKAIINPLGDLDSQSLAFDDCSKLVLTGCGTFKSPLSLGAAGVMVLEVHAQLEEAKALQSRATPPTYQILVQVLEHIQTQCLQVIKSGDPSCKRFIYLSVSLAMIRAIEAGRDANSAVAEAVVESLNTCISIMRQQLESTQPAAANGLHTLNDQQYDLSQFENMDLTFDSSWLLTAWDFAEGRLQAQQTGA